jgi:CBS domain-containing protein
MTGQVPNGDTLRHVLSKPVTTINVNDSVGVAAETMVKNEIGAVVVLEDKNPVGIITERDIIKQVTKGTDALKNPVKQVMSRPLTTASPDMSVQQAFELMLRKGIRRLPVLDGNNLVGIATEKDLMRWVLRVSYEPNVPKHIKAILEAR